MDAFITKLISSLYTTIAKNTSSHVQLNMRPNIYFLKCPARLLIPCLCNTMLISKILQITFPGLITNRAIKRMIYQQHLNHALPCFEQFRRGNILHTHAVLNWCGTRCYRLGHGAWILCRTSRYLDDACPAFAAATLEFGIVAHSRRDDVSAYFPCCI